MLNQRNNIVLLAFLGLALVTAGAQQNKGASAQQSSAAPSFVPPAIVLPNAGADAGTNAPSPSQATGSSPVQKTLPAAPPPSATLSDGNGSDYNPTQGTIHPTTVERSIRPDAVYTIHLCPLFSTGVKFPTAVAGVAVGAPSLVDAEHNKSLPNLVFIKPDTDAAFSSDVIVSLVSGVTVALHVISAGNKGTNTPVDFLVDYSHQESLLRGNAPTANMFRSADGGAGYAGQSLTTMLASVTHADPRSAADPLLADPPHSDPPLDPPATATINAPGSLLEAMYEEQVKLGAPVFLSGTDYSHVYPIDRNATDELAVSLGRMVEKGDTMTLSFSVQNRSKHWVELMPPHLEFADPKKKPSKKHPTSISVELPIDNYILSAQKLAPGQRIDGAVEFERPSFKYRKQRLLLDVASASEADMALYVPVPFTTPYGSR